MLTVPPHAAPSRSTFDWGSTTYVMGIINATFDSFSGDGILTADDYIQAAVTQAQQFAADGAKIVDIGAESTRPGGPPISGEMERQRLLPVVRAVREALPHITISVDTYRAATARAALNAGADWINDIWGLQHDPEMAALVASRGCPVVIMHNGRPRAKRTVDGDSYYGEFEYDDLIADLCGDLQQSIDLALAAGVAGEKIIVDPGIGFGKNSDQNLTILNRLDELRVLGYPILLGASRKGFIGKALGGLPSGERLEGSLAAAAVGITRGADIIRAHDVRETVRVARIVDAIVRKTARNQLFSE